MTTSEEKFQEHVRIARAIGDGDYEKAKSVLIDLERSNCCDLQLCGGSPDTELMRQLGG